MQRKWSEIDKIALRAMNLVFNYCDMIDCCDDCIFHDEDEDHCSIKQGEYALMFERLLAKRRKENHHE